MHENLIIIRQGKHYPQNRSHTMPDILPIVAYTFNNSKSEDKKSFQASHNGLSQSVARPQGFLYLNHVESHLLPPNRSQHINT